LKVITISDIIKKIYIGKGSWGNPAEKELFPVLTRWPDLGNASGGNYVWL